MTQEEKAKAYDKALKHAKEWKEKYSSIISSDGTMAKDFDSIFPQLAESEDERIRKELIEFIQWSVDRRFMREDFHQAKRPSEWIAWLEKQKENSKLEDSWHKVADSFPDSTREVICKDAIGNFFIGRYYKGSNSWEVSMYDDINKSNEDNPPVVMWCDIPSEKQKEQKPAWSEEDERVLKGIIGLVDHDQHYGVSNKEMIAWLKSLRLTTKK